MNSPCSDGSSPLATSRRLAIALTIAVALLIPSVSSAQPTATTPRAGWRVGGAVNAIARLGSVLYLGGNFRGVAPEANASGSILAVDAGTGLPLPGFAAINGNVFAIESDGAGGWYVGGNFSDVLSGGTIAERRLLAHVLPSGALDPNWAPAAEGGPVRVIRVVPGVGVFVGGDFTSLNGVARSRVGLLDPATGATLPWSYAITGAVTQVHALAFHGGQLFIGGNFTMVDGQPRPNLVVTSATENGQMSGELGVNEQIVQIVANAADQVYIGGFFSSVLGQPRSGIARLTHAAGSLAPTLDGWNPGANAGVRAIAPAGGTVYVGGDFSQIGGQPRNFLAQLDEGTGVPTAFAPGVSGTVNSLTLTNGTLYLGGPFDGIGNDRRFGAAAVNVATGSVTPWNPSPAGLVNVVVAGDSTILLGGTISGFGAVARLNLAAVDLQTGHILPWNPQANNIVNEMLLRDGTIYVAGGFSNVGDENRNGLAALDPYLGEATGWNPNVTGGAVAAMIFDATSAYIGGNFNSVGGQPRLRLARVDLATGAVDSTFAPTASAIVNDFQLVGNTLYAAGNFTIVNGLNTLRVAALNAQTGALLPGFAVSANAQVNALDLDGGFLYLGGNFAMVNATARTRAARVDATTGALDAWAPQIAASAQLVAVGVVPGVSDIDAQETAVMIAGAFNQVGGQTRLGVAAVDTATGSLDPWAPNLGTPPYGGLGGAIYTAPDVTVIGAGAGRLQLPDEMLNGLALFVEPAGLAPQPPAALTATITGNTLRIDWTPSPLGLAATSYILEAGTARGVSNIAVLNVGNTTTFSVSGVGPGTYYVRVRAVTPLGTSVPSPEIAITVGGAGCTMPPQAPVDLAFQIDDDGAFVILEWATPPGPAVTGYTIIAGSQPGLSDIATLDVGPVTSFTIPGVPPGAYYWRLVARNPCGASAPSPDMVLPVGNVGNVLLAPLPPLGLTGTGTGGNVNLSWVASPLIPVTSYRLEVGSAPGLSNIITLVVPSPSFSVSGAPPGRYFIRVRAINAGGVSLPSNELMLTVP